MASSSAPAPGLLSVCMIVKDEEAIIERCLASLECLRPTLAQVCIYDTGSTDGTIEIAQRMGATVKRGYWDNDFSRARNESLAMASTPWVLTIDADETITGDGQALAQFMTLNRNRINAIKINITNVDPGKRAVSEHLFPKLLQRKKTEFLRRLHEVPRVKTTHAPLTMLDLPPEILRIHHHWVPGEERMAKGRRNTAIAEADVRQLDQQPQQQGEDGHSGTDSSATPSTQARTQTQAKVQPQALPAQRSATDEPTNGEDSLPESATPTATGLDPDTEPALAQPTLDPTQQPAAENLSRRDQIERARSLFEWGRAMHSAQDLPAAEKAYRQALEVQEKGPFGELATEYLVRVLIDTEQYDEALVRIGWLRVNCQHRDFFDWLQAEVYMHTKRFTEALPLLRGIKTLVSSYGVTTDAAPVVQARMLAAAHCGQVDEALANGLQLMTHSGRGGGYGNLMILLWGKRPLEQFAELIIGLGGHYQQDIIKEFARSREPGPELAALLEQAALAPR